MTLALRSQLPDGYLSGWRGRTACTGRGGVRWAEVGGGRGSALVQVEEEEDEDEEEEEKGEGTG